MSRGSQPIKILTTGGTIDRVYFDQKSDSPIGEPQIGEVLDGADVGFSYSVETLSKKDSLDLTDEDRESIRSAIANDHEHRSFIVTHGTDTMVETAKVLQDITGKVIVLTGSIQPTRFQNSSAIFNIGVAVAAVQVLGPGVYVAMNGRIFTPDRVRKNREANRFEIVVPEEVAGGGAHGNHATSRGLCMTCIRTSDCILRGREAVWHCEEFEPGPSPAFPDSAVLATPPPLKASTLGLCGNCAHRDDCTWEWPEGGVWHCEEYE